MTNSIKQYYIDKYNKDIKELNEKIYLSNRQLAVLTRLRKELACSSLTKFYTTIKLFDNIDSLNLNILRLTIERTRKINSIDKGYQKELEHNKEISAKYKRSNKLLRRRVL